VNLKAPVVEVARAAARERPEGRADHHGGLLGLRVSFCRRAESTVEQVLKTYEGKSATFFRDYPLPFHSKARPAAVAANCTIPSGKSTSTTRSSSPPS